MWRPRLEHTSCGGVDQKSVRRLCEADKEQKSQDDHWCRCEHKKPGVILSVSSATFSLELISQMCKIVLYIWSLFVVVVFTPVMHSCPIFTSSLSFVIVTLQEMTAGFFKYIILIIICSIVFLSGSFVIVCILAFHEGMHQSSVFFFLAIPHLSFFFCQH